MKILGCAFAAGIALSAGAAQATTFVGSYNLTYNTVDPGLVLQYLDLTPGAGTGFTFDLNGPGDMAILPLGDLWTNETQVNWDDMFPDPIQLTFNFTAPAVFGGGVGGWTGGVNLFGFIQSGYVVWNNNGNFSMACGVNCTLNGHVSNLLLNTGDGNGLNEGYDGHGKIVAQFTGGVVPEPSTWALMILGFGGAGAMLRRRRAAFA